MAKTGQKDVYSQNCHLRAGITLYYHSISEKYPLQACYKFQLVLLRVMAFSSARFSLILVKALSLQIGRRVDK
jgi:hypothetical protein